jgi:hypothetical protein
MVEENCIIRHWFQFGARVFNPKISQNPPDSRACFYDLDTTCLVNTACAF